MKVSWPKIRRGLRLSQSQARPSDTQPGREHRAYTVEGLQFVFHVSDGSLAGLRELHVAYREGRLTDRQAGVIDRHLVSHRGDCSMWDALTEEFEDELCAWLIEHRPDSVRRIVEEHAEEHGSSF